MLETDSLSVECHPPKRPALTARQQVPSPETKRTTACQSETVWGDHLQDRTDRHVLATLLLGGDVFVTIFTSEQIRTNKVFQLVTCNCFQS